MVEAYNLANFNLLISGISAFELHVTNFGRPYFWEQPRYTVIVKDKQHWEKIILTDLVCMLLVLVTHSVQFKLK